MFEAVGVEFTNGDRPGLRLTKTGTARAEEPAVSSSATPDDQSDYQKTMKSISECRAVELYGRAQNSLTNDVGKDSVQVRLCASWEV
jgi:hypothetical protein